MSRFPTGEFHVGDCFEVMATLPDASVDMVLCDLPYGTTQNKWDSVLPLDRLWAEYWRVVRPSAAIVLTAAQPFTSALGMSAIIDLRDSFVFEKSQATGHLNANRRPLRKHEDVLVFCRGTLPYNPQKTSKPKRDQRPAIRGGKTDNYGHHDPSAPRTDAKDVSFPTSVLKFNTSSTGGDKGLHPTQKPVALFEYLIRTYTDEGMTVLDNTAGSGTTAIAAINANRRWICIERDEEYAAKAQERIAAHYDASVSLFTPAATSTRG